jgi:hypothetical protein
MAGGASGQQRAAWSERRRGEDVDTFEDWENESLAEILKAPVSALQGVSEGDAGLSSSSRSSTSKRLVA